MKSSPLRKVSPGFSHKSCREKGQWQKRCRLVNLPTPSTPSWFLVFITNPAILLPFLTQFCYLGRQEVSVFPLSQMWTWRFSRGRGFPCLTITGCPGDAPDRPCRQSGILPLLRARRSPASHKLCTGKSFIFLSLPRHVLSLNFYVCNPS